MRKTTLECNLVSTFLLRPLVEQFSLSRRQTKWFCGMINVSRTASLCQRLYWWVIFVTTSCASVHSLFSILLTFNCSILMHFFPHKIRLIKTQNLKINSLMITLDNFNYGLRRCGEGKSSLKLNQQWQQRIATYDSRRFTWTLSCSIDWEVVWKRITSCLHGLLIWMSLFKKFSNYSYGRLEGVKLIKLLLFHLALIKPSDMEELGWKNMLTNWGELQVSRDYTKGTRKPIERTKTFIRNAFERKQLPVVSKKKLRFKSIF